jgi:hypothetical protein
VCAVPSPAMAVTKIAPPARRLHRSVVILGVLGLTAAAALLTASSALAQVGTEPGALELLALVAEQHVRIDGHGDHRAGVREPLRDDVHGLAGEDKGRHVRLAKIVRAP